MKLKDDVSDLMGRLETLRRRKRMLSRCKFCALRVARVSMQKMGFAMADKTTWGRTPLNNSPHMVQNAPANTPKQPVLGIVNLR